MQQVRSRCRNQQCRTKLAIPTDNHHKAFCTPFCHKQFYHRRCLVCEKELPQGHRRQLCSSRQCKLDYRVSPEESTTCNLCSMGRGSPPLMADTTIGYHGAKQLRPRRLTYPQTNWRPSKD
jgi:hypothetical protein